MSISYITIADYPIIKALQYTIIKQIAYNRSGIIHCDFEDNLCEWSVTTEPDSSNGRGWQRKTAQQLIDEDYIGPLEGKS